MTHENVKQELVLLLSASDFDTIYTEDIANFKLNITIKH